MKAGCGSVRLSPSFCTVLSLRTTALPFVSISLFLSVKPSHSPLLLSSLGNAAVSAMALSSASLLPSSSLGLAYSSSAAKTSLNPRNPSFFVVTCSSSSNESQNPPRASSTSSPPSLRLSSNSAPTARFVARRKESVSVRQLQRPLIEYMSLPASQYSVLDAERIERVDENTFRCYVYTFRFFNFEVCPVLLVRVEEQPNGCCIKLLSCKLEGSPIVVAQNEKFDASMVNRISCDSTRTSSSVQQITSDAVIEVNIEIPFAFRLLPVAAIEATGAQVLDQILRLMLPRFMAQLVRDYEAWARGDTSRQPLGTGEI